MTRDLDPILVQKAVHTIQMLAVDAIQQANSGHPGAPMGLAAIGFELWMQQLRYDPRAPDWPNRDRFILSCGHASMLQYALLHLSGYEVSLDDVKNFRQWGTITPGHPEVLRTPGVEATTGLLGQGIANAVGMASAIKMMAARFNQHEPDFFTARVFGIASDGDIMEGLCSEACSLAGHLGLDNLVFFYDANQISIDGPVDLTFSEDVAKRFEAHGWFVQSIDGHDHEQIRSSLDQAVDESDRPSLIIARTHIGMGSPNKQDTEHCHGAPLGPDEVEATKKNIGWPLEPTFLVPDEVRGLFAERAQQGAALHRQWEAKRDDFIRRGGQPAELYRQLVGREVPDNLFTELLAVTPETEAATRVHGGAIEQRAAELVPALIGGSADLTPSVKTTIKDAGRIHKADFSGRNLHFGIREHAMGCFANGVALAGSFIPFTSTFLIFCDYMRPAMRMAALQKLPCVFVFTHDSLYVGEDGPTHQPLEHYWALRAIPDLDFFRPADALECVAAWTYALQRSDGPTVLAFSRQKVPNVPRAADFDPESMLRGGYVIADAPTEQLDAVIVATGSEVATALEAAKLLAAEGKSLRVVSLPCREAFERQSAAYRNSVLPPGVPRAVVELGLGWPWRGLVGEKGLILGYDDFGMSAPFKVIAEKLGFVPPAVAEKLRQWLATLS